MILLDTHAWWWAISEPERLSSVAKDLIDHTPTNQRCVASISLWEFSMMVSKSRINLRIPIGEWFLHAIGMAGTRVIPLSEDIAPESCNLPGDFHKDPGDRIIVATARIYGIRLVTKDRKIREYPYVQTVW
jgi:PIN domain nuclease of toxin-antitoxin system